jgi:hypothetical protein
MLIDAGASLSTYAGDLHEPPIATTIELDSRPQKGLWAEQLKKAQAEAGFRDQVGDAVYVALINWLLWMPPSASFETFFKTQKKASSLKF